MPPDASFSVACRKCPRLAAYLDRLRAEFPGYHGRPVGAFGEARAQLLIVGLAPGLHGANRTGRPFTGDHAGILLYETLFRFGFASQAVALGADDGMRLVNCCITNAVKCLPPQNKPRGDEIRRCNGYLRHELGSLPPRAAILALGQVAHGAVLQALGLRRADYPFAHGARHPLSVFANPTLFDSYHCSRYNTQTRRLTPAMFCNVIGAIAGHLKQGTPG